MHIKDFCVPRKDVKIYCKNHMPKENVTIVKTTEWCGKPRKGSVYGIRVMGVKNPIEKGIHTNGGEDIVLEVKP